MTTDSTPGHGFLDGAIVPQCRPDSKAAPFGSGGFIVRFVYWLFADMTGFLPFDDQRGERLNGIAVFLSRHRRRFNTLHLP